MAWGSGPLAFGESRKSHPDMMHMSRNMRWLKARRSSSLHLGRSSARTSWTTPAARGKGVTSGSHGSGCETSVRTDEEEERVWRKKRRGWSERGVHAWRDSGDSR